MWIEMAVQEGCINILEQKKTCEFLVFFKLIQICQVLTVTYIDSYVYCRDNLYIGHAPHSPHPQPRI